MQFIERDLTEAELGRVHAGFDEHRLEHGNATSPRTRHGFVLIDRGAFVGCATGLRDNKWYYLSDLWVEKEHRSKGYGKEMLRLWEGRLVSEGVKNIYTWTAGFQAPAFYRKQGYVVFAELHDFYQNGHARVGLKKSLA